MATGVLSLAAAREALPALSQAFFWLAVVGFVSLSMLGVVRGLRDDAGFETFAIVAALDVLALRLTLWHEILPAYCLAAAAVLTWLAVACRLLRRLPPDRSSLRGSSLLLVVSTQSLAGIVAALAQQWTSSLLAVLSLALWLFALVLYLPLIAAIGPPLLRQHDPARLSPDWWITMGALAISTVVGRAALGGARLLDLRDPVDAGARGGRAQTLPRRPSGLAIPARRMEHGLPARHVRARQPHDRRPLRPARADQPVRRVLLPGARRLDRCRVDRTPTPAPMRLGGATQVQPRRLSSARDRPGSPASGLARLPAP
jgi:hypothetical protein